MLSYCIDRMAEESAITFGDFTQEEVSRITELSTDIQASFAGQVERSFSPPIDHSFQIHANENDALNENINQPFQHKKLKLLSKFNPKMLSNLEYIYHTIVDQILSHNPMHNRKRKLMSNSTQFY